VFEPVLDKLKDRLRTLRVGDPLDKNTDVGAINSRQQLDKIKELVDSGVEEGAEIYQPECSLPERGFWFCPTLFTGVSQSHRIAREEIFGPVLSILTFRTPDEAVEKANNTPYGLSAGVWTEKGSRILWMTERLRAGVVWATRTTGSTRRRRSAGTRRAGSAGRAVCTGWSPTSTSPMGDRRDRMAPDRLEVRKTYKLYVGGAFPRSESGRSYPCAGPGGEVLARAARASRKDLRDAVRAARPPGRGGPGHGLQPGARSCTAWPSSWRAAGPSSWRSWGGQADHTRSEKSVPPSTAWSGTPAGRTRSTTSWAR
jgi:acyl-CoA reductase-like NAD-dependent aldehyde dehydrogenase